MTRADKPKPGPCDPDGTMISMASDGEQPEAQCTLDTSPERWAEINRLFDAAPPPHDETFLLQDGTPITQDQYMEIIEARRAARTA